MSIIRRLIQCKCTVQCICKYTVRITQLRCNSLKNKKKNEKGVYDLKGVISKIFKVKKPNCKRTSVVCRIMCNKGKIIKCTHM